MLLMNSKLDRILKDPQDLDPGPFISMIRAGHSDGTFSIFGVMTGESK
jgi:hypothetical protein